MRDTKGKGVLAASIFLVLALCLTAWVTPAQAITGPLTEDDTPPYEYPNVGAVVILWSEEAPPPFAAGQWQVCYSGTLIKHPTLGFYIFLTAGHCTYLHDYFFREGLIEDFYISFDYDPIEQKQTRIPSADIAYWKTHPEYFPVTASASNYHDVGALILNRYGAANIKKWGIKPATLASEGFLDDLWEEGKLRGAKFTVVGYGNGLDFPPPVSYVRGKRAYAESEFQALLEAWLCLSTNPALSNGGVGRGDSGGPIFWEEEGKRTLVAITAWASLAVSGNYRVDIPDTLDFINSLPPPPKK